MLNVLIALVVFLSTYGNAGGRLDPIIKVGAFGIVDIENLHQIGVQLLS
jgi:hypothetical protein